MRPYVLNVRMRHTQIPFHQLMINLIVFTFEQNLISDNTFPEMLESQIVSLMTKQWRIYMESCLIFNYHQ